MENMLSAELGKLRGYRESLLGSLPSRLRREWGAGWLVKVGGAIVDVCALLGEHKPAELWNPGKSVLDNVIFRLISRQSDKRIK